MIKHILVYSLDLGYAGDLPTVDEKSFFTRDFLWWLADGPTGENPRGRPLVVVSDTPETPRKRAKLDIGIELYSDEAEAELVLLWGQQDFAQAILEYFNNWCYSDGEKIFGPRAD